MYLELFKKLLNYVEVRLNNHQQQQSWKDVSLTAYFNYDKDEKWLKTLVLHLTTHNVRFDLTHLYKHWGTQVKLTMFPICKPGHEKRAFQLAANYGIELNQTFNDWYRPKMNKYFQELSLGTVFRVWASYMAPFQQDSAENLKNTFLENPKNFFVYSINNEAKGFMFFTPQIGGRLSVTKYALLPDCLKYADHFIQAFITWATTEPVHNNNSPALGVFFQITHTAPTLLLDAIKRAK